MKTSTKPKKGRPAKGIPWHEAEELRMSIPTICKLFQMVDVTVHRRVMTARPKKDSGVSLYRLGDIAPLMVAKAEAPARAQSIDGELDPAQERARKDKASADMMEMQIAEKAGKLIALDEMTLLNESMMQIVIGTLERSALTKEEIEACRADMVKEMEGKMDE